MNWLSRLFSQWFGRGTPPSPPLEEEIVPRLMKLLGDTPAAAFSCDDIHQWVDLYAEAMARGEDVSQLMPVVKMHLDLCPDCHEELEALLMIMALEQG